MERASLEVLFVDIKKILKVATDRVSKRLAAQKKK